MDRVDPSTPRRWRGGRLGHHGRGVLPVLVCCGWLSHLSYVENWYETAVRPLFNNVTLCPTLACTTPPATQAPYANPPPCCLVPPLPNPKRNERCTSTPGEVKRCERRPPPTLSEPQAAPLPQTRAQPPPNFVLAASASPPTDDSALPPLPQIQAKRTSSPLPLVKATRAPPPPNFIWDASSLPPMPKLCPDRKRLSSCRC